jgi:hypothetical protein
MNDIELHINKMFEEIPESRRKEEIIQEITQNLNEKISDLVEKGQTREQAVKDSLADFGDINDLKRELESSARLNTVKNAGLSLAFSVWGGILITALVLFINFYYTPEVIWFVYPAFGVVWWPMVMFFRWIRIKNDNPVGLAFSVCSYILIIGVLLFINVYYTPRTIWVVYPAFAVLWWTLVMFFRNLRKKNGREDAFYGQTE